MFISAILFYKSAGAEPPTARIVNGDVADTPILPLVKFHPKGCMGVLISNKFILTAYHCFKSRKVGNNRAWWGGLDKSKLNRRGDDVPGWMSSELESVSVPPGASSNPGPKSTGIDIALVKLKGEWNNSDAAPLIPNRNFVNMSNPENLEREHQLAGWGTTSLGGSTSKLLRTATVHLRSCAWRGNPWEYCAGGSKDGGKDACQGDSGGPVLLKDGDRTYVVGIVSWGAGCGKSPGAYSSVYQVREWIKEVSGVDFVHEESGHGWVVFFCVALGVIAVCIAVYIYRLYMSHRNDEKKNPLAKPQKHKKQNHVNDAQQKNGRKTNRQKRPFRRFQEPASPRRERECVKRP